MTPSPSSSPSSRRATPWARRARRGALLSFVVALVVMLNPSATFAHEFGPFAIDRYAAIRVAPDEVELDYVLSLAETPTQADGETIEADPEAHCTSLATEFELLVDGSALTLDGLTTSTLREDGDGGLTTLRVVCNWVTPIEATDEARSLSFDDANFSGRVGWREVIVVGDRTAITGDVSDESLTSRLTDYPDPSENPDTRSVTFDFVASTDVEAATLPTTDPGEDDDEGGDAFSNLISSADGGIGAMMIALGFAAFLGALHSLAPGHGKTVIGAYLVGTRGTKIQAFVLAVAVALSHTLGVLILGIITYAAGAAFAPERVYPWLQGLSAVIVFGIGVWLVWTAVSEFRARSKAADRSGSGEVRLAYAHGDHGTNEVDPDVPVLARTGVALVTGSALISEPSTLHGHQHGLVTHHDHDHPHDDHDHDHPHDDHDHDHPHDDHDHPHDDHDHPHDDHDHPHDDHDHPHDDHDHPHDDHDHPHDDHDHDHDHPHDHDHDHDHGDGWHRHGIFPHTHKFDLDEMDLTGKVSWKTLAMLGLSGGLVPSTSAIIVLLGAIQLNRLTFGGLLILAFGIGMAIALVSVGLGMVALRDRAFGAMDGNSIVRTARIWVVPIAAVAVLLIGVFLLIRAVIEINGL